MAEPKDRPEETEQQAEQKTDWKVLHLWQIQGVRDVLVLLSVLGLLWLGQKTSVVTVPLLLAMLFAYLLEPVIVWVMAKTKMQRRSAVIAIMAFIVVVFAIPAAVGVSIGVAQMSAFTSRAIQGANAVQEALNVQIPDDWEFQVEVTDDDGNTEEIRRDPPEVQAVWDQYFPPSSSQGISKSWLWVFDKIRESRSEDTVLGQVLTPTVEWIEANQDQIALTAAAFGAQTAGKVVGFVGAVFGLTFTVFVTAFFFFFVATEWVKLQGFGAKLLPDRNRDTVLHLLSRFDEVISGFIRGRLTIAFIQALVFSVGYLIIGVPAAFILGPIVAVLSIVPYLALVGLPISIVLLALSVDPSDTGLRASWIWIFGAPTAFYFIGQALDDYVWTPLIQGKSTGMDTPTILFASLAGGALFGVFGLLIAIPIAACLKILIQELFWPRFKDWAEGREQDFLPIGRD